MSNRRAILSGGVAALAPVQALPAARAIDPAELAFAAWINLGGHLNRTSEGDDDLRWRALETAEAELFACPDTPVKAAALCLYQLAFMSDGSQGHWIIVHVLRSLAPSLDGDMGALACDIASNPDRPLRESGLYLAFVGNMKVRA